MMSLPEAIVRICGIIAISIFLLKDDKDREEGAGCLFVIIVAIFAGVC